MAANARVLANERYGGTLAKIIKFLRSVWGELKKVHWPTRKELVTYTGVVLVSVVIIGVVIWLFDSFFSLLLGLIL